MEKIFFVLLTFAISLTIGWIVIPKIVVISKIKRLFDKPDERKVHKKEISRLGGVSFVPALMISVSLVIGFRYYLNVPLPMISEVSFITEFMFLLAASFIIFFVGLTDDLVGVSYKAKFAVQILSATLIAFTGLVPQTLFGIFGIYEINPYIIGTLVVVAIVFVINAYNLIDGVDGLCSGLSSVALLALGIWFTYTEGYIYAMIAMGMLGVLLAFFYYNISSKRLKIFMGDTGSLTLGLLISFLSLKFLQSAQVYTPGSESSLIQSINSPLAIIFGLLFVPIFDTLRVFTGRIMHHKSPFSPDKTHIHHKMLALGLTHIRSTITIIVFQIGFVALNITLGEIVKLNINTILLIDVLIAVSINALINRQININAKKIKTQ